ncbi:MAG: MarR family winged helix-turn-helix transcriptional regulator [Pseudomonadota bacterium]
MDHDDTSRALRLAEFLPYRLSVLSNTVSTAIAADYQREFGLNIWQWRIMAVIGESAGLTASDVAARTAMDKVAVSRAVAALEARGLLQRQADPGDARAALLDLTEAGRAIYEQIVPLALAHERRLLDTLTGQEQQALEVLLDKLASTAAQGRSLW